MAFTAAVDADLTGRFRVWERAGLLAASATNPALGFLSTVSGVAPETVPAAIELASSPMWDGVRPTIVVSHELDQAQKALLRSARFVRTDDRGLAVRSLPGNPASPVSAHLDVVEGGDVFARVLVAGYEASGPIAAYLEAEHRHPLVRRFVVWDAGLPIAAAAMTIHGDVAVLGGASVLRAHRGKRAQSRLLQSRLRVAVEAGCDLAVATVRPESVSAANLKGAGFELHHRSTWAKSRTPG